VKTDRMAFEIAAYTFELHKTDMLAIAESMK
jgi:hypothetical protein